MRLIREQNVIKGLYEKLTDNFNKYILIYYMLFCILFKFLFYTPQISYSIPFYYIIMSAGYIAFFVSFSFLLNNRARIWYLFFLYLILSLILFLDVLNFKEFSIVPVVYSIKEFKNLFFAIENINLSPNKEYFFLMMDVTIFFIACMLDRRNNKYTRNIKAFYVMLFSSIAFIVLIKIMPSKELKVNFIDVGYGDSIFVEYGKHNILIDGGYKDANISAYLKKSNINDIDIIISTHADGDHLGGLIDVINNFNVKTIIDNGQSVNTNDYMNYWNVVQKKVKTKKIKYIKSKNIMFELDRNITLSILKPGSDYNSQNNSSVVSKISYKDIAFLFTGDIGTKTEAELQGRDIKADVLKVPHHGSDTSSSEKFLNKVSPKYGVVSVGENPYGNPGDEGLKRIQAAGINMLRTDVDGTVVFMTDGKRLSYHCTN